MTTLVAHPNLTSRPGTLTGEHLAQLAQTFEDAAQPVWIHDFLGRCIFRNRMARHTEPSGTKDSLHDILDALDRRVGHLRMRMT